MYSRFSLIFLAFFLAACPSPDPGPTPQPTVTATAGPTGSTGSTGPTSTPTPTWTIPASGKKVVGFTIDSVDNVAAIVKSIQAMPAKPWVRIVFDYPQPASDYASAVAAISAVATVVGQPSDSTYAAKMSVAQYQARFQSYVSSLPQISIWETCNECNGDWAGSNTAAQAEVATQVVKAAGKKALYVPYWNSATCADQHGPYIAWTQKNISAYVKSNTDYVMTSIYGMDCDGAEPAYSELDSLVTTFVGMFPNAQVGIGEYGAAKAASKLVVMQHYLAYQNSNSHYLFFGGYWYGYQDLLDTNNVLWKTFAAAMN